MAGQNVLLSKDVMIAAGAIGFNYSVTMGIIFVNKLLFLRTKFPVLTLAASHLAVSALFTRAAMYAGVFKPRDAKMDRMIFAVAALQTLTDILADGQTRGLIREGDAHQFATLVWSLLHGVAVLCANRTENPLPFGSRDTGEMTQWFVDNLLMGLTRGGGR